jgi:hypothetical protein
MTPAIEWIARPGAVPGRPHDSGKNRRENEIRLMGRDG